jgi:CubicO group peptidase (beta-lactamase class C family)
LSRKLLAMLAILVLMSCLLYGCAPSAGEMNPATASRLQSDVDAVVSAVDASRWDAAIAALDQLEADVADAQAAGGVSDRRAPRRSAPPAKEC